MTPRRPGGAAPAATPRPAGSGPPSPARRETPHRPAPAAAPRAYGESASSPSHCGPGRPRTPRGETPATGPSPVGASRPTPRYPGQRARTVAAGHRPPEAIRRAGRSRLQTCRGPGPGLEKPARQLRELAGPARTVMHPCLALHPELHGLRPQVIAAPVRRPRNDDLDLALGPRLPRERCAEALRRRGYRLEQRLARAHRLALRAGPGTHAARPRPGGEVRIAVRGRRLQYASLDAHLPVKRVPVDHRCRPRVLRQLPALARQVIRIKDEVAGKRHDFLA